MSAITAHSGRNGHKSGYPKHRKRESLLCRKNRRFELTPLLGKSARVVEVDWAALAATLISIGPMWSW
jgi:hypothetical protein